MDEHKGVSCSMRTKEEAHDYRYFPEPDLMPIVVDEEWKEEIKRSLPELPDARRKRYVNEYGLPDMMLSFLQAQRLLQIFLRRRREMQ